MTGAGWSSCAAQRYIAPVDGRFTEHRCRTPAPVEFHVPEEIWEEWDLWETVASCEVIISRGIATLEELDALGFPRREAVERLVFASRVYDSDAPS